MNTFADKIYLEAQRLPDDLARQVYDFIRFIEMRHGLEAGRKEPLQSDWQTFFSRHCRTLEDARPLTRDEVYVERLR